MGKYRPQESWRYSGSSALICERHWPTFAEVTAGRLQLNDTFKGVVIGVVRRVASSRGSRQDSLLGSMESVSGGFAQAVYSVPAGLWQEPACMI